MLDGAAALESGSLVQEGGAVDGEGAVRGVVLDDWGCGTSEGTGEGLDVVAGGEDAGEAGKHDEGDSVLHLDRLMIVSGTVWVSIIEWMKYWLSPQD